jgi:Tol biopolymer transport system component
LSWDLDQNQDLFKLRANPLEQLCYGGATLNQEQTLLAIAYANGAVGVRNRDGQETVLCPAASKPIQRGSTKFWFSPDSRLLAYSTNVQFDGRINNDSLKLELYDLSSGTRLWSKPGFSRLNLGEPESLFSADGLSLRLRSQERIDCLTGAMSPKKSNAHATEIISHSVLQYGCDRVLQCRAVKDTDCWRKLQIVDADTDEVLAISEDLTWPHRSPYGYSPLPDGKHVARVRILEAQLEIWDVAGSKQVVSASGNFVTFSQDGRLCAVATREYQIQERTISAKSSAFDEVTIWDVRTSQPISKLSLSGDKADNAKFSPDGSRLLTLHGTQAKGTGGDVPSGRLWDIASGREIMSIPVADVNHYLWDLVFDPEGNQLTSLVYAKSAGTAGGLGATTFDATPLLSASEIATAMRVTGWGASWSPDGRKIVRNKKRDADESNDLEIIDLDTGDTQSLCKGGVDPYWSPVPGGPIAFVRGPEGKRRDLQNETVWLIEADGSNLRKVADGGFPTITRDGSLYFRQQTAPSVYPLFRMELRADSTPKEIILGCPYPTVSFDGKKRAATKFTSGLLEVSSIENPKDTIEISIGGNNDGAAGWSPDGRYIAFGSWNTSRSGLWLIDLQEKKVRLLANAKLTMPRWSPDGTRIACDDRVKDEVLILDVAHLNLSAGLPKLP